MNKNPSLKDPQMSIVKTMEEVGFHYSPPKPKWIKEIIKNVKEDSVMVIDLDTLQLRPPKYD